MAVTLSLWSSTVRVFSIMPLICFAIGQTPLFHSCSRPAGTFTAGSDYSNNFNSLISTLRANRRNVYGYHNFSKLQEGGENDRCNAVAFCLGDTSVEDCERCILAATVDMLHVCPKAKEAIIWYPDCMLRYSNRPIFGEMETHPAFPMHCSRKANFKASEQTLWEVLLPLRMQASSGDLRRKYATGVRRTTPGAAVNATVQCTPDLSQPDCDDCLKLSVVEIQHHDEKPCGWRNPSCMIEYEVLPVHDTPNHPSPGPVQSLSPQSNKTEREGNRKDITKTIIIVAIVPTSTLLSIVLLLRYTVSIDWRKRKLRDSEAMQKILGDESLHMDFETIRAATNNFSSDNKIGQGGFGIVYKGRIGDGKEIAVKRLSKFFGQGDREFVNEVSLLAKLQHRNLVRLVGFCLKGVERLLIYEHVQNSSLYPFIFDPNHHQILDWDSSHRIMNGIARGLLYLHEDSRLCVIHRDLKPSNILLDNEMNPKIADFGMARLFNVNQTEGTTERIVGTYGYMAPEYAMHGQISTKVDVFSFGVILLEIISGIRNNNASNKEEEDSEDLLGFAWKTWQENRSEDLVRQSLIHNTRSEIVRYIHIGLLCVQENLASRPTMAWVVNMLNNSSMKLPVPSKPPFLMRSPVNELLEHENNHSGATTTDRVNKDFPVSINMVTVTQLYPR